MTEIRLAGCTPEPLMSYLKGLGIFRLVAEDKKHGDVDAKLSWRGGMACLHTRLTRDELTAFFLQEYKPTPIMTPWNSASGFAPTKPGNKAPKDKAAREAANYLAESEHSRLQPYSQAIRSLRRIPRGDEAAKNWKRDYFMRCRANLPDNVVCWLDTCFALTNADTSPFPLLGSGGNDGVTEFGSLFMQRLSQVITDQPTESIKGWLLSCLFSEGYEGLLLDTIGQFNPGGIGGPNGVQTCSSGRDRSKLYADSRVNPWDFVLMIEGALLFAGSVARRMGASNVGDYAAFPFCVEGIVVGNGSFSQKEARERGTEAPNGGELWLPLWSKEVGYLELMHLFAEGRAQFGRRQARTAIEFGLAVNLLGVSRGIDGFSRTGFLRRNGKAFLAIPLGRILVHARPKARLLSDQALLEWLDRFRDACRETDRKRDKIPSRYKTALRQVDRAMFAFAHRSELGNDAKHLVDVLMAIGRAERMLADVWPDAKERRIRPVQRLSPQWLEQVDDSNSEFRLAAALAGIRGVKDTSVGPFRVFIEPIEGYKFINWPKDKTKSAVWSNRPLATNLAAVFRRRLMEACRSGLNGAPLSSPRPARLSDVLAFLKGDIDDDKLTSLLWALPALDWSEVEFRLPEKTGPDELDLPFEFGVPRLLVERLSLVARGEYWNLGETNEPITPDAEVFHLIGSGQRHAVALGVDRAARRLKSGGRLVNGYRNRQHTGKSLAVFSSIDPERLLAAMLFPLANHDLELIANAVLYPPESKE